MELSQKLKKLRKEQGLTQLDLSESLFVSRQAISGWEAGTSRPSTENLQFLSKLYNVPMEYLLDDSKDMHGIQRQRVIDTGLMIHQTMLMREIIPVQTQQE